MEDERINRFSLKKEKWQEKDDHNLDDNVCVCVCVWESNVEYCFLVCFFFVFLSFYLSCDILSWNTWCHASRSLKLNKRKKSYREKMKKEGKSQKMREKIEKFLNSGWRKRKRFSWESQNLFSGKKAVCFAGDDRLVLQFYLSGCFKGFDQRRYR